LGSARVDAHLDWIDGYTSDYTLTTDEEEPEEEPEDEPDPDDEDVPNNTGDGDGDASGDDDGSGYLDVSADSGFGCHSGPAAMGLVATAMAALGARRRR
ncbi:MAG: hypothetical protein FJ102_15925, partial [Deltaproteobacteria bacterium]|nr:hypothetical protein [Deltaproteobacteria bacterium]